MLSKYSFSTFEFINLFFLGGRRGFVSLGSILRFATGAEKESVLGLHFTTQFTFHSCYSQSFLPTSNTCILNSPSASVKYNLPEQSRLFQLYDFSNQCFKQK